jgi:hypothetical protein
METSRSEVDVHIVTYGNTATPSEIRRGPGVDEVRIMLAELDQPHRSAATGSGRDGPSPGLPRCATRLPVA